jgi:hypothetical protein
MTAGKLTGAESKEFKEFMGKAPMKGLTSGLVWLAVVVLAAPVSAQVGYYKVSRQKWLSQLGLEPVPLAWRFAASVGGANLTRVEVRGPVGVDVCSGNSLQMSFATNYPAVVMDGTNLVSGWTNFNARYPTGEYMLYTEVRLGVPITKTYALKLTNDLPTIEPRFTNVTPLATLQPSQTFQWPVFTSDPSSFCRFFLLEGDLSTNLVDSVINGGMDALTNSLTVLAWQLNLPPTENSVTVNNLDPLKDHVAVLEFHAVNPINDPLGLSEASSISINVTLFFGLQIIAQPQSQTVVESDPAIFSVAAVGAAPLAYQWRFNGVDILNATNLIYVIPVTAKSHQGEYSVVVKNPAGTEVSEKAVLTVAPPTVEQDIVLSEPAVQAEGKFRFLVEGEADGLYAVEASPNLRQWEPIGTVRTPLGAAEFVDTNAAKFPLRFYRAKSAK